MYGGPVVAPGGAGVTLTCKLRVYSRWSDGEVVLTGSTTFPGDFDDVQWFRSEATVDGITWFRDCWPYGS